MDDLISRKAAIEAIKELLYEPDSVQYIWSSDALTAVKHAPSVPAVPLDKLCLLLHDIAGSPCYTQQGEEMCNRLIGDQCNTEWDDVECWKRFLAKWMEASE